MQYGRRSDQAPADGAGGTRRDDERGWVCSQSPEHFTLDTAVARVTAAASRPGRATGPASR
jgi:hypothetical protein